jgi:hypothetical protein
LIDRAYLTIFPFITPNKFTNQDYQAGYIALKKKTIDELSSAK